MTRFASSGRWSTCSATRSSSPRPGRASPCRSNAVATSPRISVHDEGPGISDDGKARIFEVFQREEETAHLPGLGLGLFITKQIAESHGGTVSVESEHGHGATFLLQVPLAREVLAGLA